MKATLLSLFLALLMFGCGSKQSQNYTFLETKNFILLDDYPYIPLYGVNSIDTPKNYKLLSQISMTTPVSGNVPETTADLIRRRQPQQGRGGVMSDASWNEGGHPIRKKALILGANAVVNVRKKIMEMPIEDQFGKRRIRVLVTTGDAVFDPRSKRKFITKELIEVFNRQVLGLPKMKGREEFGNLSGWRFFLTPGGDILCEDIMYVRDGKMERINYPNSMGDTIQIVDANTEIPQNRKINRFLIKAELLKNSAN